MHIESKPGLEEDTYHTALNSPMFEPTTENASDTIFNHSKTSYEKQNCVIVQQKHEFI